MREGNFFTGTLSVHWDRLHVRYPLPRKRLGRVPHLLVTFAGHHWRPVQTCSFEDLPLQEWRILKGIRWVQAGGTHPTGVLSCRTCVLVNCHGLLESSQYPCCVIGIDMSVFLRRTFLFLRFKFVITSHCSNTIFCISNSLTLLPFEIKGWAFLDMILRSNGNNDT